MGLAFSTTGMGIVSFPILFVSKAKGIVSIPKPKGTKSIGIDPFPKAFVSKAQGIVPFPKGKMFSGLAF